MPVNVDDSHGQPTPVSVPTAYALMTSTIVIFASAFAGIRYMLNHMDVMAFTGIRLTIGVCGLLLLGIVVGISRPRSRDLPILIATGLCGFSVYHLTLNYGAATISAGQASILVATIPVWTAFAAHLALGEEVSRRHWVGLAASVGGVAVMSLRPEDVEISYGTFWVIGSTLFAAANITISKKLVARYRPLQLTILTATLGSIPFILWVPTQGEVVMAMDATQWGVMLYLGVFPITIGYWTATIALAALPAYRTAQFLLLIPPVAAAIAWVTLGEVPSTRMAIGGAIILAGVAISTSRSAKSSGDSRSMMQDAR